MQSAPTRPGKGRRLLLWSVGGVATVCALAFLLLCIWVAQRSAYIFPNVSVGGVPLGNETTAVAQARLVQALPALQQERSMTLLCQGEPVATLSYGALSQVDPREETRRAHDQWREGAGFFACGWRYLQARRQPVNLAPQMTADAAACLAAAEETAQRLYVSAEAFSWSVEPDAVAVTLPREGRTMQPQALAGLLEQAVAAEADTVVCDRACTVTPAQALTAEALYDVTGGEMTNAGYDPDTDTITPARPGVGFDTAAAQRLLEAARPGEQVRIPARVTLPQVEAAELEKLLFRDVLGTCTTLVEGTEERKTNVRLSAAAIDGVVLGSGEVFDYNAVLGRRTTAKGYREGPAFVGGKTVLTVGGGICQTTSNLYYAAVLANMDILVRSNHGFVCDYIAPGFDAAVSWGGPHFRFQNSSLYPVKIQVGWEGDELTVTLWGSNPQGNYVEFTNEILSTTPYEELQVQTDALAPGVEEEKVAPYVGHRVKTYRSVYDREGRLISRELESTDTYKARDRVVWVGAAVPATEPAQ